MPRCQMTSIAILQLRRHVDDMNQRRQSLSKLPRRASEQLELSEGRCRCFLSMKVFTVIRKIVISKVIIKIMIIISSSGRILIINNNSQQQQQQHQNKFNPQFLSYYNGHCPGVQEEPYVL